MSIENVYLKNSNNKVLAFSAYASNMTILIDIYYLFLFEVTTNNWDNVINITLI